MIDQTRNQPEFHLNKLIPMKGRKSDGAQAQTC